MPVMNIVMKKTSELHHPDRNCRSHSDEQIDQLISAIKRFGFRVPLIVGPGGEVIAGNGRLQAAKKLRIKEVPCIDASDLNEDERRAFALADNKIAANSTWDEGKLHLELSELKEKNIDIESLGFTDDELLAILAEIEGEAGEVKEVEMKSPPQMAWCLIGLPIQEFADMQKLLDSMPRAWRIVVSATDKKDIGETLDEANENRQS